MQVDIVFGRWGWVTKAIPDYLDGWQVMVVPSGVILKIEQPILSKGATNHKENESNGVWPHVYCFMGDDRTGKRARVLAADERCSGCSWDSHFK